MLMFLNSSSCQVITSCIFRRLQAREDAAKRKDESMLLSTKKIIDSTDDVLRSAKTLLKSTEYKDGNEDSSNREYPAISSKKYPAS